MVRAVVAGVADGGVYALVALGIFLAHRDAKVLNLAHGEIGTFAVLLAASAGMRLWPLGALLVVAVAAATAAGFQRLVIARGEGVRAGRASLTVATIGLALLLIGLELRLPTATLSIPPPLAGLGPNVLGYHIAPAQLMSLALAVGVAGSMWLFEHRTFLGVAVRAASDNRDGARVVGIPTGAISVTTWAAIGGLAGFSALVAGSLFGPIHPGFGTALLVRGLAGAVIGGLGSPLAVVAGGLCVGVVDAVAGHLFATSGLPGSSTLAVMALLLVFTLWRAQRQPALLRP